MDSLVKNNENEIFEDLEASASSGAPIKERSSKKFLSISGDKKARELSGGDKYRVAKVNTLDIFGWVLTFLVLWAVYTIFSNLFSYFFSSSEAPSSASKSSVVSIESRLNTNFSDLKDKASLLMHKKERLKNSKSLSLVEQRLESISDLSQVEHTVSEEDVEEAPSTFSLGRAIQGILNDDISR